MQHAEHPLRREGAVGKQADLVVCSTPDFRRIFYHFGVNHVWRVYKRGRLVHEA